MNNWEDQRNLVWKESIQNEEVTERAPIDQLNCEEVPSQVKKAYDLQISHKSIQVFKLIRISLIGFDVYRKILMVLAKPR